MSPLALVVLIALAVCMLVWLLSLVTHDHSWVDRLWSIVPVVYVWVFALAAGLEDARLTVMAVIVTLWGARLTFNFARKGGYTGMEDYRWAVLRGRMPRWAFGLFSLLFIVLYQNALLVLITLPAFTAWQHRLAPFTPLDAALAVFFVGLLVGETVADEQQWRFHRRKRAQERPHPRFLQTGLWRYSRHPNFFFEQAQWWVFFLLGASAAGSPLQWTVIGPLLLTLLFVGSTAFTESIARGKYPEYADYQATTSPIVLWPPRRSSVNHAAGTTAG
jgi:steroid 5-alpha reductase family enzyme